MIAGYISDNTGKCNFNLSSNGLGQIRTVRYDYVCAYPFSLPWPRDPVI